MKSLILSGIISETLNYQKLLSSTSLCKSRLELFSKLFTQSNRTLLHTYAGIVNTNHFICTKVPTKSHKLCED